VHQDPFLKSPLLEPCDGREHVAALTPAEATLVSTRVAMRAQRQQQDGTPAFPNDGRRGKPTGARPAIAVHFEHARSVVPRCVEVPRPELESVQRSQAHLLDLCRESRRQGRSDVTRASQPCQGGESRTDPGRPQRQGRQRGDARAAWNPAPAGQHATGARRPIGARSGSALHTTL
jgi:hypothetical protein